MANMGIMHISYQRRGGRPLCGTRRAIMCTTPEFLADWPRVCVKCATKHADAQLRSLSKSDAGLARELEKDSPGN